MPMAVAMAGGYGNQIEDTVAGAHPDAWARWRRATTSATAPRGDTPLRRQLFENRNKPQQQRRCR